MLVDGAAGFAAFCVTTGPVGFAAGAAATAETAAAGCGGNVNTYVGAIITVIGFPSGPTPVYGIGWGVHPSGSVPP